MIKSEQLLGLFEAAAGGKIRGAVRGEVLSSFERDPLLACEYALESLGPNRRQPLAMMVWLVRNRFEDDAEYRTSLAAEARRSGG